MTSGTYTTPDGRPKATGAPVYDHHARVRLDETPAPNDRVAITVAHASHDGGVRTFYRPREWVAAAVRRHVDGLDVTGVTIVDDAGVGLSPADVLDTDADEAVTAQGVV